MGNLKRKTRKISKIFYEGSIYFTYIRFSGQVGCPSCEEETGPFARYKKQRKLALVTTAKATCKKNILTDSQYRYWWTLIVRCGTTHHTQS